MEKKVKIEYSVVFADFNWYPSCKPFDEVRHLKCRINTNPIEPDVVYNNVRMSDMAYRIRRDREAFKRENEDLKKRLFNLELIMKVRNNILPL